MPNLLSQAEEDLARVGGTPFEVQLSDFDGEQWAFYCRRLKGILQTRGEQAARDATKDLERLFVYPKSVVADLLRDVVGHADNLV